MSAGKDAVEQALRVALEGRWETAPFGMNRSDSTVWHMAQAEAYQHALEMMADEPYPKIGEFPIVESGL